MCTELFINVIADTCIKFLCFFFPGAATVVVRVEDGKKETQYPMDLEDEAGYYAVLIPGKRVPRYVFHITYEDGKKP